jgi:SAM-dependent methyltransferase
MKTPGVTRGSYLYDMDNPRLYRNAMGYYKTHRQLSFIRRFLTRDHTSVIDFGGGSGRLAIPIANLSHRVTVVDKSAEALELLHGRAGERIEGIQSDLMSLRLARRFELALAIDMLKYRGSVPLADVFGKVNSHLEMGGSLVIAEINRDSWRYRFSQVAGKKQPYSLDSPEGYTKALIRAGFEVQAIEGFVWIPLSAASNSPFVRVFKTIEEVLHLEKWIQQSPWLLIGGRKVREWETINS